MNWQAQQAAALQNSWSGALYYRKNGLNQLWIKGSLTAGTITAGTVIATLPEGYRPSIITPVNAYASGGGNLGSVIGIFMSNTGAFAIRDLYGKIATGNTLEINTVIQMG